MLLVPDRSVEWIDYPADRCVSLYIHGRYRQRYIFATANAVPYPHYLGSLEDLSLLALDFRELWGGGGGEEVYRHVGLHGTSTYMHLYQVHTYMETWNQVDG